MKKPTLVVLLMTLVLLAGCEQVRELPPDQAQAFAGKVEAEVENMLVGLSQKDYAMHSRDFDQAMLDTVDPITFPSVYAEIIGVLGAYHSHKLLGVQQQSEYYVVRYTAVFDKDPEVTVRVVFAIDDPDHKITGLWFDSKLLRGK